LNCSEIKREFACEQLKINCLFACEVEKDYVKKRFGVKSCKADLDNNYLWDLLQLFNYNTSTDLSYLDNNTYRNKLYLDGWFKEMNGKDCVSDFKVQHLDTCNMSELIEKINLL
jgi:hypothetical protein